MSVFYLFVQLKMISTLHAIVVRLRLDIGGCKLGKWGELLSLVLFENRHTGIFWHIGHVFILKCHSFQPRFNNSSFCYYILLLSLSGKQLALVLY